MSESNRDHLNVKALIKFYERREYAESFLNGEMYINRLKKIKENGNDIYECCWDAKPPIVPKGYRLEISKESGEKWPDSKPFPFKETTMERAGVEDLHVFCMYMYSVPLRYEIDFQQNPSYEELEKGLNVLEINDEMINTFGEHAIVIPWQNIPEFRARFKHSASSLRYSHGDGPVKYVPDGEHPDPDFYQMDRKTDILYELMYKKKRFEHEKEYRFVIDTLTSVKKHITLNLGDLSDIAIYCNAKDINNLTNEVSRRLWSPLIEQAKQQEADNA